MKRIISLILTFILVLSALAACKKKPQSVDLMTDIKADPQVKNEIELTEASNTAVTDFSVRLFQQSFDGESNTLISPLSVLVALSMTANGADNETLSQMEKVLGMPTEQLNPWISTYMNNLPEGKKYKLNLANAIWFNNKDSFDVNEDFLQTNANFYNAGIYEASFNESTRKEINKWVEDNTDGMIKDILDEIPPEAVMYLVNALAFDAEWQTMYEEHQVSDGKFTTEDGKKRDVEYMYCSEHTYLEDENAKGFVKYYKDRKYAFVALLPDEDISVSEYVKSLDGKHLNDLLANPSYEEVRTSIPKFETEYKVEMKDVLSEMGMPDAFSESLADFTRLGKSSNGNICINRVIHQTYIKVDEKGTKAGAATVVEMKAESAAMEPLEPPKEVYLDRPFVYMLIDCETNIPFFIGTTMDVNG